MARAIHLTVGSKDGCGSSTKHLGAYMGVTLAQFNAAPAERKCARCLSGKLFAFVTRPAKVLEPIISHDGNTWRVIGQGVQRDGKTYCHLASTSAGHQQQNGWNPAQIGDWIDNQVLATAAQEASA